jgi:tetratricopeptide (TPR) repeat protein
VNTTYTVCIDESFGTKDTLFGSFSTCDNTRNNPTFLSLPASVDPNVQTQDFITHFVRFSWDHVFTSSLLHLGTHPSLIAGPDIQKEQRFMQHGWSSEAEDLLREILGRSPDSGQADILLKNILIEWKQFETAEQRFEAELMRDFHDQAACLVEREAAIGLALQNRRAGNGEASLRSLEHARTFLYGDPVQLTDLGSEADILHDYEHAAIALEAVLKNKPNDPTALYPLAWTESDRDHPQKAESLFRSYIAKRPNDASAYYDLMRLLKRQQRKDGAVAEFGRSIALQPVQTESSF